MCTILTTNGLSANAAMQRRDSKSWVQSNQFIQQMTKHLSQLGCTEGLSASYCLYAQAL